MYDASPDPVGTNDVNDVYVYIYVCIFFIQRGNLHN